MTDGLLFHYGQWGIDDEIITQLWDKELNPIVTYETYYSNLDKWAGFRVKRENDLLCNLAGHHNRTGDP